MISSRGFQTDPFSGKYIIQHNPGNVPSSSRQTEIPSVPLIIQDPLWDKETPRIVFLKHTFVNLMQVPRNSLPACVNIPATLTGCFLTLIHKVMPAHQYKEIETIVDEFL